MENVSCCWLQKCTLCVQHYYSLIFCHHHGHCWQHSLCSWTLGMPYFFCCWFCNCWLHALHILVELYNTGSGHGLVPSGNKPLPGPVLTHIWNDCVWAVAQIDGLVQYCRISIVKALEMLWFCKKPSKWWNDTLWFSHAGLWGWFSWLEWAN